MSDPVKSTRRYESPRRREQAAATRREILAAAQLLFERDGFAPTTMAAIATEAGVSLKTVYVVFESKSGVLRALWHLLLRGDQDDVPVQRRDWYREVIDETDPQRRLRLLARGSLQVKQRAAALMGVISSAAQVDPDSAVLWARIQTEFWQTQRGVVEALHACGDLRAELDVDRGADILWTLNHPDLWHLLVGQRGWTPESYEEWFRETVAVQLLRPDAA